jgi:hypothetical protein
VQLSTTGIKSTARSIRSRLSRFLANLSRAIDGSPEPRPQACFGVRSATIIPGVGGPTSYTVMLHDLSSSDSTLEQGTARFWVSDGYLMMWVVGWTFRVVSFTGEDVTSKSQLNANLPHGLDAVSHFTSADGSEWIRRPGSGVWDRQ